MYLVNKIGKKSKQGFTLVELVLSLGIFGIVTVIMSGIVINLAGIAYFLDRRNDFLVELESAVSVIRNEMRNAQKIGLCPSSNYSVGSNILTQGVYLVKNVVGTNSTPLAYAIYVDDQSSLVLALLQGNPEQTQQQCVLNAVVTPQKLTSQNIKVQNFQVRFSQDQKSENTVLYMLFEACDDDSIPNKIFTCRSSNDNNAKPYRYVFSMSTRNY